MGAFLCALAYPLRRRLKNSAQNSFSGSEEVSRLNVSSFHEVNGNINKPRMSCEFVSIGVDMKLLSPLKISQWSDISYPCHLVTILINQDGALVHGEVGPVALELSHTTSQLATVEDDSMSPCRRGTPPFFASPTSRTALMSGVALWLNLVSA